MQCNPVEQSKTPGKSAAVTSVSVTSKTLIVLEVAGIFCQLGRTIWTLASFLVAEHLTDKHWQNKVDVIRIFHTSGNRRVGAISMTTGLAI